MVVDGSVDALVGTAGEATCRRAFSAANATFVKTMTVNYSEKHGGAVHMTRRSSSTPSVDLILAARPWIPMVIYGIAVFKRKLVSLLLLV